MFQIGFWKKLTQKLSIIISEEGKLTIAEKLKYRSEVKTRNEKERQKETRKKYRQKLLPWNVEENKERHKETRKTERNEKEISYS